MASMSMATSWAIVTQPVAAEPADLGHAFALHGRSLYRYFALRTGGDAHRSDDLMQQLWLRAKRGAAGVPAEELEYWLRGVAKNLIREHWRGQARRRRHVPTVDSAVAMDLAASIAVEDLPIEYLERQEVRDQLVLAITELATVEQELLVRYYFEGQSLASLAVRLGNDRRWREQQQQAIAQRKPALVEDDRSELALAEKLERIVSGQDNF